MLIAAPVIPRYVCIFSIDFTVSNMRHHVLNPPFQESRKRKKRRLEELQRSVLFLTHENHQLREQNELLRQMLVGRLPGSPPGALPAGTAANPQIAQPVVEVRLSFINGIDD